MVSVAVPDVSILAVHLFTVCFNVCARLHQRLYDSRGRESRGNWVGVGVESCKIVFPGAIIIHLCIQFCCSMYYLATIHFVTDRQTGRQMTVSCQQLIILHAAVCVGHCIDLHTYCFWVFTAHCIRYVTFVY